MNELDDLQAWLCSQIQSPRFLPDQAEVAQHAALHLAGNDRLSAVEQLEIYRNQFWLRHTAALLEDFPGVSRILGQSDWEALAESYLERHPPRSWTLRDLGQQLESHIRGRPETPHQALCADMAALEWGYVQVFDAPDATNRRLDAASSAHAGLAELQSLKPEAWHNSSVIFTPALFVLDVAYPVAELRRALCSAGAAAAADVPIPDPNAQHLALYRGDNLDPCHQRLPPPAAALLRELLDGTPLLAACEHVASQRPEAAQALEQHIGSWFQLWGGLGWIHGLAAPG